MQKGSTAGIVLAAFGVLVVVMWAGYYFFKEDEAPTPQLINTAGSSTVDTESQKSTRSFVVFDTNFAYSGGSLYYRSGTDSSGKAVYTILPVAEPEKFERIASISAPVSQKNAYADSRASAYAQSSYIPGQTSTQNDMADIQQLGSASESGTNSYTVSYYTDGQNVYVVVTTGDTTSTPQIVPGVDPESFHVLSSEYSADDNHVYVVTVTCIGTSCSVTVSVVQGADPETFQPFPNQQQVMNADCTGYVYADAQDQRYLYNNGQVVDGVSVYLIGSGGSCDNTPVLISP